VRADLDRIYTPQALRSHNFMTISDIAKASSVQGAREALMKSAAFWQSEASSYWTEYSTYSIIRDCARVIRAMCGERASELSGFDMPAALHDLASGRDSMNLSFAFIAEVTHLLNGLERPSEVDIETKEISTSAMTGRIAARARTADLDRLWASVEESMGRYGDGLDQETVHDRARHGREILKKLGGTASDWGDGAGSPHTS